jgi:hypothetical protein
MSYASPYAVKHIRSSYDAARQRRDVAVLLLARLPAGEAVRGVEVVALGEEGRAGGDDPSRSAASNWSDESFGSSTHLGLHRLQP